MRRAVAVAGCLALAALGLTACAPDRAVTIDVPAQVEGDLPESTLSALQGAVSDAMAATGSSGALVGVWAPWSGSWVTGVGTVTPGGAEVSTDMTFRAGKVTRAMTCDALYELAAAGTLSLNDSITKWVGGVPDLEEVTLLQLCNGTSGVGAYQSQLSSLWIGNPERVWKPAELASYGLGQARTKAPGEAWRDSDAGYVLLGLALSRAAGTDASEVLTDQVFAPLGLEATALPTGAGQWADGSSLHGLVSQKNADGKANCAEPTDLTKLSTSSGFTDSGVVTTITDLGRYTQALAAGSLTKGQDVAKNRWAEPNTMGSTSWFTATGGAFQAGSLIGQYGSVPGYLTAAFSDPQTGLTVAVVLNNSAAGPGVAAYLAWELAAIASKAPASEGQTAPELGLPWTADNYHEAIQKAAVCDAPAS